MLPQQQQQHQQPHGLLASVANHATPSSHRPASYQPTNIAHAALPPPPPTGHAHDTPTHDLQQTIQSTRNKLRNTSSSSTKKQRAKRAQSIDWTAESAAHVGHMTPTSANHQYVGGAEDYYSVPRKCHRTVSSDYLDAAGSSAAHVAPSTSSGATTATNATSDGTQLTSDCHYPWSDPHGFSTAPVPPSSPPPTPPYANQALWADDPDAVLRADSMHDVSKYY